MILDLPQPEIAFFNESDLIFVRESKFLLPNYNVMLSLWLFENGNIDGKYDAHLHLSVYKATVWDKIWSKRDSNYVKDEKLRNPFNRNHRFDTDGDL